MFDWHAMLLAGDRDIKVIGGYRTHAEPMQVVSGPIHKRTVHFEAPPSARVPKEMSASSHGSTTPRRAASAHCRR